MGGTNPPHDNYDILYHNYPIKYSIEKVIGI